MHATICDHIADIVENALAAGAPAVRLDLDEAPGEIRFAVTDQGPGMDTRALQQALDPFFTDGVKHPARRVGLGLPFLKQAAEQTGGAFDVQSESGRGTAVRCRFATRHLDTPPLGDLAGSFVALLAYAGAHELTIHRSRGDRGYAVSRRELAETLGGLDDAEALALARDYLRAQEDDLRNEGSSPCRN